MIVDLKSQAEILSLFHKNGRLLIFPRPNEVREIDRVRPCHSREICSRDRPCPELRGIESEWFAMWCLTRERIVL